MCWMVQIFYRSIGAKTLIFFMAAFSLSAFTQASYADYNDEPWPEPVYFPQRSDATTSVSKPAASPNKSTPPKEKWRLFKKKAVLQSKETAGKEAPVVPKRESAQDPPTSPYPLLRLAQGILTEQGIVPSGIYLIRPEEAPTNPLDKTNTANQTLVLTQRNKVLLVFTATPSQASSESKNLNDTLTSPLQKKDSNQTEPPQARITVSEDGKRLQIHYYDQQRWLESPEFLIKDNRQLLINY